MIPQAFRLKSRLNDAYEDLVPSLHMVENALLPLRARIILKRYRRWREDYETICGERGLVYREHDCVESARKRLADRGYTPRKKRIGHVHTFAFIPRVSWHFELFDDLHELGDVSEFDYVKHGYTTRDLYMASTPNLVDEMNATAYDQVVASHHRDPLDWVFIYASGAEVTPTFIKRITDDIGVPVALMSLDDKQSWALGWIGNSHRRGQIDLTPHVDLTWTTSRTTCGWHLAEGGRPLLQPEGSNSRIYYPRQTAKDIGVCFVGQRYGFRANVIRELHSHGIEVTTHGKGWRQESAPSDNLPMLFSRSRINLGMGGIGFAEYLTNVKGRDFDVPCTGGGTYITSYSPELSLYYDIGKEIVCYRSRDELLELVRYYLKNEEEARIISISGRDRCLREHRWFHRFLKVCRVLGIVNE